MSTPCFGEDAVHAIRSGLKVLTPPLAMTLISETRTQTYVQIALATVLVYTTFTSIDKEIKFFWNHPGRLVSWIYFATRYIGILSALSNFAYTDMVHESLMACVSTTWIATLTAWISMTLVDYILLMRVVALYSKNKKLETYLTIFFCLEALIHLALQLYINIRMKSLVVHIEPNFSFCDKKNSPPPAVYIARWILPMLYGLILLGLALHRANRLRKISRNRSSLLKILVLDQGIYYLFVILCCVFRILVEQEVIKNWLALNVVSYFGSPIFLTVLGSQMLLRLKEVGDNNSAAFESSNRGPGSATCASAQSFTQGPHALPAHKELYLGLASSRHEESVDSRSTVI